MYGIEQALFVGKILLDPKLTTDGDGIQLCTIVIEIDKGNFKKQHTLYSHKNLALTIRNKISRGDVVLFNCEPYSNIYGFGIQTYQIIKAKELR